MIEVLVNADDFGLSRAVNHGILNSHKNGIVNSATMMMNAPATAHAIRLSKDTPTLKVGIHLVLTEGRPLLDHVPSLVDETGNFKSRAELYANLKSVSLDELEREWTAQIERFCKARLTPTHFDSHHHVHGIPEFLPVVKKLATKYRIPVRKAGQFNEVPTVTDIFLDDFKGDGVKQEYFQKLSERISKGMSVEIMTHPAYLEDDIHKLSSYSRERLRETGILMQAALPDGFVLRYR